MHSCFRWEELSVRYEGVGMRHEVCDSLEHAAGLQDEGGLRSVDMSL